jgi:hypothetical protein
MVKIGQSADPAMRLFSLFREAKDLFGNTSGIAFLAVWQTKNSSREEGALHKRFRDHRIRGEWFSPDPEILALSETKAKSNPQFYGIICRSEKWAPVDHVRAAAISQCQQGQRYKQALLMADSLRRRRLQREGELRLEMQVILAQEFDGLIRSADEEETVARLAYVKAVQTYEQPTAAEPLPPGQLG